MMADTDEITKMNIVNADCCIQELIGNITEVVECNWREKKCSDYVQ